MADKHLNTCSNSLFINEMQINISEILSYTHKMAKIKKLKGQQMLAQMYSNRNTLPYIDGGIENFYNHSGNQLCNFSQNR